MKNIFHKKSLVSIIILLFLVTTISPTILGSIKVNQNIIKNENLDQGYEYLNIRENDDIKPIEELCNFYDLEFNDQILNEDIEKSLFYTGYFDYTIKGYITDSVTNDQIEDATILILWNGKHFSFDRETITTDSSGFYEIKIEDVFYGEIIYFVRAEGYYSYYEIPWPLFDNEVIWINASLTPGAPPKNSIVSGYVLNADNAGPIEGAVVDINWVDNNNHGDWLYTFTDSSGFYSVNVPAGEVMPWIYTEGYYEDYKPEQKIGDGETLDINIYLYPQFPDSAKICGYVTEEQSGDPIEDVLVILTSDNWDINHFDLNYTFTDSQGYYEIMVAESDFRIEVFTFLHAWAWSHGDYINEGEIYWWNTTLYAIPPQTAVICGNITDMNTNDPIKRAYIAFYWDDGEDHSYRKYALSDDFGFYKITIAPGVVTIYADAVDYFDYNIEDLQIGENETVWLDISLELYPPQNSIVEGFIKNNKPFPRPIKDANVAAYCYDDGTFIGGNHTESDKSGFYQMKVTAGEVSLSVRADGHYYTQSIKYLISEGETLRIDVYMEAVALDANIVKPKRGVYKDNQYLFPFIIPVIIGDIDIEVNGSEELYEVEFYIDGEFKQADRLEPLAYTWDDGAFGLHRLTLVYNGAYDNVMTKKMFMLKLF